MAKKTSTKTISAEEFDRKFDAGEDISAYIDWKRPIRGFPARLPDQKTPVKRAVSPRPKIAKRAP